MKNKNMNQLDEWLDRFFDKFKYLPKFPDGLYIDNDEAEVNRDFIATLQRCVETGVDETIEKYGTWKPSGVSIWDRDAIVD